MTIAVFGMREELDWFSSARQLDSCLSMLNDPQSDNLEARLEVLNKSFSNLS